MAQTEWVLAFTLKKYFYDTWNFIVWDVIVIIIQTRDWKLQQWC